MNVEVQYDFNVQDDYENFVFLVKNLVNEFNILLSIPSLFLIVLIKSLSKFSRALLY